MNREQATELLLAFGSDDHGDRRDAIVLVLDLLQESTEPNVNTLGEFASFPGRTPRSMNEASAEIERLKRLNHHLARDWGRIEKLVGLEFTSPESVIDRIAFLAEVEKTRPTKQRFDELQAERDELLAAARAVLDNEYDSDRASFVGLLTIVEQIDKNPREGN